MILAQVYSRVLEHVLANLPLGGSYELEVLHAFEMEVMQNPFGHVVQEAVDEFGPHEIQVLHCILLNRPTHYFRKNSEASLPLLSTLEY